MSKGSHRKVFQFRDAEAFNRFLGPHKVNLRELRKQGIHLQVRAYRVILMGDPGPEFDHAVRVVSSMKGEAEGNSNRNRGTMSKPAKKARTPRHERDPFVKVPAPPRIVPVQPKTPGQRDYMAMIKHNDVVFGLGPAGTGKTFLAVSAALLALEANRVERIVITRPAVEAGEKLGFLPGSFSDKVDPYLQPIYDSLNILAGKQHVDAMRKDGRIEIAPLAYMRGRTLANAFVLLDEAQNCTWKQIVMLLTRLGENSRCVVTGDASQTDLHRGQSGLQRVVEALWKVEGIGVHRFGPEDVVRHPLVARIVEAIEEYQDAEGE